jgi:hypothetical protein
VRPISSLAGHARRHLVGYLALFCFALGGTALALPGKNTVDSGDLKRGSVRTADIGKRAVTNAKLGTGSVDGRVARDDSLTGADIDEGTLRLPPSPAGKGNVVGRIAIMPTDFNPGGAQLKNASAFATLDFPDNEVLAFLSTAVPGDWVEGTPIGVRLLWSSNAAGGVRWELSYRAIAVGESVDGGNTPLEVTTTADAEALMTTTFEIPAADIEPGDALAIDVARRGLSEDDTNPQPARLQLVELIYSATD